MPRARGLNVQRVESILSGLPFSSPVVGAETRSIAIARNEKKGVPILTTIKIDATKARAKLQKATEVVETSARDEAALALRKYYLPKLKELAPRGVHYGPRGGILDKPLKDRLAGSFSVKRNPSSAVYARVESTSPYVRIVISGAKRHRIEPSENKEALAFWWPKAPPAIIAHQHGKGSENKYLCFRHVMHPGQKANPFHRKALTQTRAEMKGSISKGLKTKIAFEIGKEGGLILRAKAED